LLLTPLCFPLLLNSPFPIFLPLHSSEPSVPFHCSGFFSLLSCCVFFFHLVGLAEKPKGCCLVKPLFSLPWGKSKGWSFLAWFGSSLLGWTEKWFLGSFLSYPSVWCIWFLLWFVVLRVQKIVFFVFLGLIWSWLTQKFFCNTKASIFFASFFFVLCYDFSQVKSLNIFGCSAFILFSDFSQYKSLNAFVFVSLLQRAHCFLYLAFCVFVLFWWSNGSIYFWHADFFMNAEKVEEHIKAAIFISKTPWVQVRKYKSLNFFRCSTFILFFDFSQYKSLNFFVFLSLLQRAHCFTIFNFSIYWLHLHYVLGREQQTIRERQLSERKPVIGIPQP